MIAITLKRFSEINCLLRRKESNKVNLTDPVGLDQRVRLHSAAEMMRRCVFNDVIVNASAGRHQVLRKEDGGTKVVDVIQELRDRIDRATFILIVFDVKSFDFTFDLRNCGQKMKN